MRSCATCQRIIAATQVRCDAHEAQYNAERQAQRLQYRDPRWLALRAQKVAAENGHCQDCDYHPAKEVHHRFAVKDGNPLICPLEHLLLLCKPCHLRRERGHVEPTLPGQFRKPTTPRQDTPQDDDGAWVA